MKQIPFYTTEDNRPDAIAVFRMLYEHFLGHEATWEEMQKMSAWAPGQPLDTLIMWRRMNKQGFNIESHKPTMEGIDKLLDDGRLVFLSLPAEMPAIEAEVDETDDDDDIETVHAIAYPHTILITARTDNDYTAYDPTQASATAGIQLSRQQLWEAMGEEQSTSEVTGVKFRPRPVRADQLLADMHPMYSRAALAKLFGKGMVSRNGKLLKPGEKLPSDAVIEADLSSLTVGTANIDLPILYEDDNVIVINKPAGILTHVQGAFSPEATVASFLRQKVTELTGARAGIVHRLDRATSGVIICTKNAETLSFLQKQFADREVKKVYIAITEGHLKQKEAIVDMPIERNPKAPATFRVGLNGKPAKTHYKVIEESATASLVELRPETGRTHQLRVHMQQVGNPIVGDPLYGSGTFGDRLYLHAFSLQITLPGQDAPTVFIAPLPDEFNALIKS